MVVRLDVGIEHNDPLSERLRLKEPLLGKQVEGIVHRGTRDGWAAIPDVHPYFICGWMDGGAQSEFGDGNALRRGLNSRIAKPVDNTFHKRLE
jgi:hypothetical protein